MLSKYTFCVVWILAISVVFFVFNSNLSNINQYSLTFLAALAGSIPLISIIIIDKIYWFVMSRKQGNGLKKMLSLYNLHEKSEVE
jgi:hypothetical protein